MSSRYSACAEIAVVGGRTVGAAYVLEVAQSRRRPRHVSVQPTSSPVRTPPRGVQALLGLTCKGSQAHSRRQVSPERPPSLVHLPVSDVADLAPDSRVLRRFTPSHRHQLARVDRQSVRRDSPRASHARHVRLPGPSPRSPSPEGDSRSGCPCLVPAHYLNLGVATATRFARGASYGTRKTTAFTEKARLVTRSAVED
jgi:hypothetical protein